MTVEYLSCVICLPTAFLLNAALICGCFSLCLAWRTQRQQRIYKILSACKLPFISNTSSNEPEYVNVTERYRCHEIMPWQWVDCLHLECTLSKTSRKGKLKFRIKKRNFTFFLSEVYGLRAWVLKYLCSGVHWYNINYHKGLRLQQVTSRRTGVFLCFVVLGLKKLLTLSRGLCHFLKSKLLW